MPFVSKNAVTAKYFDVPRREMHYLSHPQGFSSGMAQGNLGYQMAYSIEVLEERLADNGKYCVLQLNMDRKDGGWMNPTSWSLYANGSKVASGSGTFARECFYSSESAFLEACQEAIEGSNVPEISGREYDLLKIACRIAAFEPFDDGSCILGERAYRVF